MVGALAFLLQTLVFPILASSATSGELIQICTANGVAFVPAPGEDPPSEDQPKEASWGHCPLCPLMAGLSLPPGVLLALPVRFERDRIRPLTGEDVAAAWFLATLKSRAPPLAA